MFHSSEFTTRSTDRLEQDLTTAETLIAQLRGLQSRLIRELTHRQTPTGDGYRTVTDWVGARADVAPETARRLVKLATAHDGRIDSALAEGVVSFDRAVELTRLDSDDPISEAGGYGIPRLRSVIASRRSHSRHTERDRHANRHLVMQPNLDHTALRLWGELVGVDSVRVEQILTDQADAMPSLPDGTREPRRARLADALSNAVIDSVTSNGGSPSALQVTVFVDARQAAPTSGEVGVQIANGPRIGPQTLEAIMCDATVEVTALTQDGRVLGVGDRSSTIPPRLHRYIRWRDQSCAADGCTSRYRLEVHHIRERSHGGDHHPDNLVLLCWHHHHVVIHGRGFTIDPDSPSQRLRFHPPRAGPDPP